MPDRTTVQIDVVGRDGFDPIVAPRESGGRELSENDDGGQGFNSWITMELSSGTYFVEVRGFAGEGGDFQVIVTDR